MTGAPLLCRDLLKLMFISGSGLLVYYGPQQLHLQLSWLANARQMYARAGVMLLLNDVHLHCGLWGCMVGIKLQGYYLALSAKLCMCYWHGANAWQPAWVVGSALQESSSRSFAVAHASFEAAPKHMSRRWA
jgi:hypothetical protein